MSKRAILELDHDACKTQAMAYLEQGFNCAQAVACTLAPAIGLDVDQTFRLMEGFGGGMGGYTETCGAVSGAVMADRMGQKRRKRKPRQQDGNVPAG